MKDFLQKTPKPLGQNEPDNILAHSASTTDYYSAPTSDPSVADSFGRGSYNDSRWYSLEGRVGRIRFLAISMIWGLLAFVVVFILMILLGLFGNSPSSSSLLLVYLTIIPMSIYTSFLLPRRRLHDLDKSGWLILLAFIPLINVLFYLYLIFARGDEGVNRFGLPPAPYSRGEFWLVILPLALMLLGIGAAIMMPNYYEEAVLESQVGLEEIEAQIAAEATDGISNTSTEAQEPPTNSTPAITPSTTAGSSETLTYEEFMAVSEEELYYESELQ